MQGEAVAFALGGNRKMLRTGNLAGLLNRELAAARHRTAEVGAAAACAACRRCTMGMGSTHQQTGHTSLLAVPALAAQVILHMEVMQGPHPAHTSPLPSAAASTQLPLTSQQPQHTPSQPTSSAFGPMSPDHSHASLGLQQQHTATQQQHHTQQGQAGKQQQQEHAEPQQHLKLKRVLRGGASKGYIMRPGSASWSPVSQVCLQQCLQAVAGVPQHAVNLHATCPLCVFLLSSIVRSKRVVVPAVLLLLLLQAELQAELAPYGIDTLVVDRYIVSLAGPCVRDNTYSLHLGLAACDQT